MRDRAKWDAWKAVEGKINKFFVVSWYLYLFSVSSKLFLAGKSKEEAKSDYITKVKQLLEEAGITA